jgi:hypothetical protein
MCNTVRSLISENSFLLTHFHQKCVRKEISRSGFFRRLLSRYSVVHSIDLRRGFLRCVNISIRIFGCSVSCPGLYGGLYGQNLPYELKKSYSDFQNRNFEKSYRTSRNRKFLGVDQGCFSEQTVPIASRSKPADSSTVSMSCISIAFMRLFFSISLVL